VYYGILCGVVVNYVNVFVVMSREHTIPYDAQSHAAHIGVPTALVHSEKALAPALARSFHAALSCPKAIHWLESGGQIDFYDDPRLIAAAADIVATHLRAAFAIAR